MKGPESKCPNCGMPLEQIARWNEYLGTYFEIICEYCEWRED